MGIMNIFSRNKKNKYPIKFKKQYEKFDESCKITSGDLMEAATQMNIANENYEDLRKLYFEWNKKFPDNNDPFKLLAELILTVAPLSKEEAEHRLNSIQKMINNSSNSIDKSDEGLLNWYIAIIKDLINRKSSFD